MPELPEVEITCRGIAPHLQGRSIADVIIRQPRLRWPIPDDLPQLLTGLTIDTVSRRAKYILIDCGMGMLIFHLGMSGSLRILSGDSLKCGRQPEKHDHFDLVLADRTVLRLRDPRRFGAVIWCSGVVSEHSLLKNLGPEPLTEDFSASYLFEATRYSRSSIKQVIMNNQVVVGIGNIYANEALFLAGMDPKTVAGEISKARYDTLIQAIKKTLELAIEAGGSSVRDFVQSDGKPGYFQHQYWVYGRSGQVCKKCGNMIKQMRQGQRSSFYCACCQH